jgi:GcrA cell cycle regulator
MKQCNACGRRFGGRHNTCAACIIDIYDRYKSGEASRSIAIDYDMTRNQIIGLMHRNTPSGFRHPKAQKGTRLPARPDSREIEVVRDGLKNGLTISEMSKQLDYGKYSRRVLRLASKMLSEIKKKSVSAKIPESKQCRYPFGEPGTVDFHFCGMRQQSDSSYCSVHHEVCYQRDSSINKRKKKPAGNFRLTSKTSLHTYLWR